MKECSSSKLLAATLAVGFVAVSFGATRTFAPNVVTKTSSGDRYYWTTAENWTDENGEPGVPKEGDDVITTGNETVWNVQGTRLNSFTIKTSGANYSGGCPMFVPGGPGLIVDTSTGFSYWLSINADQKQDLSVDVRQSGCTVKFTEHVQGDGRYLKRGPGELLLGEKIPKYLDSKNGRTYSHHGVVVEQGRLLFCPYDMKIAAGHELVFSGNDPSARFVLNNSDQTFASVNFYETNGVANVSHGFSSKTASQKNFVRFTGNPVQKPTVFSGQLYNKVGLVWAPDAATDEFVFSNAVSFTTGELYVTNGVMRLVTGASFQGVSSITVAGGGVFAIDSGAGMSFSAEAMQVGAQSKLTLGADCDIRIGALAVEGSVSLGAGAVLRAASVTDPDGQALAEGRYTADNLTWLNGAGLMIVGTVSATEATWTGNGGAATSVSDARNWGEATATDLPDLVGGATKAHFGTGGSAANLDDDIAVSVSGLVLERGADFAFTADTGAKVVRLGGDGITTATGTATYTYTMGWPLQLLETQAWTLGGNTLKFDAPLSGAAAKLSVTGPGTAEFNAAGSLAGDVYLTNGIFTIGADNACATGGHTLHIYPHKASKYLFKPGTHDFKVNGHYTGDDQSYPPIHFAANANVTFNDEFYKDGYVTMNVAEGATVTFRGGVKFSRICKWTGTGRVVVENKPLSIGDRFYVQDNATTIDLCVANNKISGWVGNQTRGRVNTRVPYALVVDNNGVQRLNISGSFILDLCGNDQAIGILGGSGGQIRSDEPAFLHLVSDYAYTEYQIPNYMTNSTPFVGLAGFSKEGTKVPYYLNVTSSTTGTLQVVAGELTMLKNASWPNSTNVVVKGGVLKLTHKGTFGKQVTVSVSGEGQINLAAGIRQRCKAYLKNGVEQPAGTYGATGSGAEYIDDTAFAGAGILKVGRIGSLVILR